MPSIGQTWVLASIGAVVEINILSTLKRLLVESNPLGTGKLISKSGFFPPVCSCQLSARPLGLLFFYWAIFLLFDLFFVSLTNS
jgi:hypothetical protein